MLSSALCLSLLIAVASADPASDAAAACNAMNLSTQFTLMRGYGPIAGYSRNSGCAGICGRSTFRWDNGPQGFGFVFSEDSREISPRACA